MRDMKLRDMKMRHQNARVENARHEFAAPDCRGGKCDCHQHSGVTMGWLLRLVTGGPTGDRGPQTVLEFLVINFSVCLVLLSNCYIIIYCIV